MLNVRTDFSGGSADLGLPAPWNMLGLFNKSSGISEAASCVTSFITIMVSGLVVFFVHVWSPVFSSLLCLLDFDG